MTNTQERGLRGASRWDVALIVAFLAALFTPTVDQIVRPDAARDPTPENRPAAPFPGFPRTWSQITAFPAEYDASYRDTFGLRDVLLGWNSLVRHYVFQVGTSSTLVPDGTDWINYAGDRTFEIHRGLKPFDDAELAEWQRMLESRANALAALGIHYVYMIAPNKETIYPERVPACFNSLGPTRMDQLVEWLELHSSVQILDLRPALRAEKQHDQPGDYVYSQLGTHWSVRGSRVAYRALISKVQEWYPETRMLTDAELVSVDRRVNQDSWAEHMYIPHVLVQRERELFLRNESPPSPHVRDVGPPHRVAWENDRGVGPRTYLYHDSFGPSLFVTGPATFPSFECVSSARFELAKIQEAHAELVVELFVERILVMDPPLSVLPRSTNVESIESRRARVIGRWAGPTLEEAFGESNPEIRANYDGQKLRTEWLDTPKSKDLELEVEVESTRAGRIEIYWRSDPEEEFVRSRRTTARVKEGVDRARFHLGLSAGNKTQYLLRALDTQQVSTIHSVELRIRRP